jgi:hypothetical protein
LEESAVAVIPEGTKAHNWTGGRVQLVDAILEALEGVILETGAMNSPYARDCDIESTP